MRNAMNKQDPITEYFNIARIRSNISQIEISRQTGVSLRVIQRMEQGKRHINGKEISLYCKVLGIVLPLSQTT